MYRTIIKTLTPYMMNWNEVFEEQPLTFDETEHKYHWNFDKRLSGVTTEIDKYTQDIPWKVKENCAKKEGITVDELEANWKELGRLAAVRGTAIHKEIELLLTEGKSTGMLPSPLEQTLKGIVYEHEQAGWQMYNEVRVAHAGGGLAGTADVVFINENAKAIKIIDFKTNKEVRQMNTYNKYMKAPFAHLADIHISHYTLQLSAYAYMIKCLMAEHLKVEHIVLQIYHINHEFELQKITLEYNETDVLNLMDGVQRYTIDIDGGDLVDGFDLRDLK